MALAHGWRPDDKKDDKKDGDKDAKPAPIDELKRRLQQSQASREEKRVDPALAPKPPGPLTHTSDLLQAGGFTRMLTWSERRALRRIEKSALSMRKSLSRAFYAGRGKAFLRQSCDALASIEVTAKLELMREAPTVEKPAASAEKK